MKARKMRTRKMIVKSFTDCFEGEENEYIMEVLLDIRQMLDIHGDIK